MSEFVSTTDPDEPIARARNGRAALPPIRPTDGERLMRFWRHRDQAAFAEVVELHAGLVWGVCSQVLRQREDVEDAFQATFLILARKAKSIRAADSAAGWLYRVAFRTALLARQRRQRRAERPLADEPASDDDQLEAIARNEQCRVLLEELHALPMQVRQPLVLCYLEGRSRSEAAEELGLTPQSVKGRLARGTDLDFENGRAGSELRAEARRRGRHGDRHQGRRRYDSCRERDDCHEASRRRPLSFAQRRRLTSSSLASRPPPRRRRSSSRACRCRGRGRLARSRSP